MKLKNLKKKIRRLETRLKEGPKKLAKLKRKFEAQVAADKTKKESAARAAVVRRARSASTTAKPKRRATAKVAGRSGVAKKSAPPKKAKRKLNLSPERRAELAEAMRARWAAKRAAAASQPRPPEQPDGDFRIGAAPQGI